MPNLLARLFRWLIRAALALAIALLAGSALIVWDGLTDDLGTADVGVVLGNKVELNGKPSARLQARLDRTLELYQEKRFPRIIVSGGTGREGFDEAVVMRDYLVSKGIPATQILVDSQGINTQATAVNSAALATRHAFHSAMAVTQYFHVPRSQLALERSGFTPVYTAHARYFEWRDVYSTLREVVGYAAYWCR